MKTGHPDDMLAILKRNLAEEFRQRRGSFRNRRLPEANVPIPRTRPTISHRAFHFPAILQLRFGGYTLLQRCVFLGY